MVSQERVQYLVEVLGGDTGANAFVKVGKAVGDSGTAVNRHSQALRDNAKAAELNAQATQRNAAAQQVVQRQFTATATAARSVPSAGLPLSVMAQRASIGIGGLATAAQGLSPALTGVGAAVSRASGSIGAFTQLFGGAAAGAGGGPWGIALGVAVTGLGLLSASFKTAAEEAEDAAKEMAGFVAEMKAMGDAALEAENKSPRGIARRLEADRKREEARRAGLGGAGFFSGANAASPVGYGTGVDYGTDDQGNRFTSQQEAGEYIDRKAREAGNGAGKKTGGGRRGDPLFESAQREAENRRRIQALYKLEDKEFGSDFSFDEKSISAAGKTASDAAQADFDAKKNLREMEKYATIKQYEEQEKAAQQYHDTLRSGAQDSWGMVGSAAGQAFAAIARGEKVSLKAILQSIGSNAIAAGTMKLFEAAGWAFIPGGQATATGLAAVGGAQIAFGAALSGAGAAAGGSKGGGGGSGSTSFANQPMRVAPSTETGGRSQPMVVNNYHLSSTITPTSRDAQAMREAEADARRNGL